MNSRALRNFNKNFLRDDFTFKFPDMNQFTEDAFDMHPTFRDMFGNDSDDEERKRSRITRRNKPVNDLYEHFENFFKDEEEHFDTQMTQQKPDWSTSYSKSYVSKTKYNQNGEPISTSYQTQSINQTDKDGHKITETQEAFNDAVNGIQKASHQRLLDGKGHKILKTKNLKTGETNEENLYKGMNQNDLEEFNKNYANYSQKVNFKQNYDVLKDMKFPHERNNKNINQIGTGNNNF